MKTTYESGATRSSDTLGCRLDLIPFEGLLACGEAMHEGAVNHGDHNWKKGLPYGVMINHALQHISKYMCADDSEDHIGHAIANLMMLKYFQSHRKDLDDRCFPEKKVSD